MNVNNSSLLCHDTLELGRGGKPECRVPFPVFILACLCVTCMCAKARQSGFTDCFLDFFSNIYPGLEGRQET